MKGRSGVENSVVMQGCGVGKPDGKMDCMDQAQKKCTGEVCC